MPALAQALFTQVEPHCVLTMHDVSNIWRVPGLMESQGAHRTICQWVSHFVPSSPFASGCRTLYLRHHLPVGVALCTFVTICQWVSHFVPSSPFASGCRTLYLRHHLPVGVALVPSATAVGLAVCPSSMRAVSTSSD